MCVNKVAVFNKEDKTYTYHNCGKCVECLNIKSLNYSRLLERQFDISETQECCFVTLKYNQVNVPLVKVSRYNIPIKNEYRSIHLPWKNPFDLSPRVDKVRFTSLTERVREYYGSPFLDTIYAYTNKQIEYHDFLLKPVISGKVLGTTRNKLPHGVFPILFMPDVQLFMKRFRDRIYTKLCEHYGLKRYQKSKFSKYEKEKIRLEMSRIKMFCCGEYGPKTFRPHYHLLLFFDSPRISRVIEEVLSSSWSLGSINIKRCDSSGVGKYVSEYCNSVVSLPPIYTKFAWAKTKVLHSIRIGVNESKELNQDIHKVTFSSIKQKIVCRNGKFESATYPVSLENYLFPKTYRFSKSDDYILRVRYELYARLVEQTGLTKVKDIYNFYANEKFGYLISELLPEVTNKELFHFSDNICATFKKMLYTSRRFLKNLSQFNVSSFNYLRLIKSYYDEKNSFALSQWYKILEDDSKYIKSEYLINYYSNIPKSDLIGVSNEKYIELFSSQTNIEKERLLYALENEQNNKQLFELRLKTMSVIRKKIKHKEQNDKNIEFIEYE